MEWSRGPEIGRGATATVSLATTSSGEIFAVKTAEISQSIFLQREQRFLSQLISSPRVIQYMGFEITRESNKPVYNLFMEYVAGGTISDAIKSQGGSLGESSIRIYAKQILQGLNFLHSNGVVHCDIKGQNLLIGKDGVKIADLGCARSVEDGGDASFAGTPLFMAPEVARGEEQGFPADIWALGCTAIEMATGSNPWPEVQDPVSALYRIGFSSDVPELPSGLSDKAKDFLAKCLRREPRERWTAKQLLQHPFVEDLEFNYEKSGEFAWNSPTTVLNQDFWDTQEACEAPPKIFHTGSSSGSPAERIRRLIGGSSNLPNWSWDEDWVEVRSNGIGESMKLSDENSSLVFMDTESFMFSADDFEEQSNSIVSVDLLTECSVLPFSIMPFESVRDVYVQRIFSLIRKLMEVLLLFKSSSSLSLSLSPFSSCFYLSCFRILRWSSSQYSVVM